MIKTIQQIQDFGIFKDYSRPQNIEDFSKLNLIYGWNYSGKTTLSRIFRSIELGSLHSDYSGAQFKVSTNQGGSITESSLSQIPVKIRVFNSDFIKDNLSLDGDAFVPILLLGQESIEIQKKILRNKELLPRLLKRLESINNIYNTLVGILNEKKSAYAKSIKTNLQLVETFNRTHLDKIFSLIEDDPKKHIINDKDLSNFLSAVKMDEKNKLSKIQKKALSFEPTNPPDGLKDLLARKPYMSNRIDYLKDNPEIANWILTGLDFHKNSKPCEFCKNQIDPARIEELKAHFSDDVIQLDKDLKTIKEKLENSKPKLNEIDINNFYHQWKEKFTCAQLKLKQSLETYNKSVDTLIAAVDDKLNHLFKVVECPPFQNKFREDLSRNFNEVSTIIDSNNEYTDSLDKVKEAAITNLKRHYAATFYTEEIIAHNDSAKKYINNIAWYESTKNSLIKANKRLEEKISRAQRGREELNIFIKKFLVGSNISVEVKNIVGGERFQLLRDESPAKNLSDGERTAIAYAYFLTKLKEEANLNELIVYIDDPVSSLDSNHLFQLFATTRSHFFDINTANKTFNLKVKQLFISTHNFEFLGLLKELRLKKAKKHFLVNRLAIDNSILTAMPKSIREYKSEYHYLWNVLYKIHKNSDTSNLEQLLLLPNALRRFVELYTYSKCPSNDSVDERAKNIFGEEKSKRIIKLLHYFSHSNNLLGISQHNDLICDIKNVVNEIFLSVKEDEKHYDALMEAIPAEK